MTVRFKVDSGGATPAVYLAKLLEMCDQLLASSFASADLKQEFGVIKGMADDVSASMREARLQEEAAKATRAKARQKLTALRTEFSKARLLALAAAGTNVDIAKSFGFLVVALAGRKALTLLTAPVGLRVTPLANGGLVVECDKVKGAKTYLLDRSFDPYSDASWVPVGGQTSRRRTVRGLPPGQKMWFRMAAVGVSGQSPWSAPFMATIG